MLHCRLSKFLEECGGSIRPIWTVCLDEMVRCVAVAGIEEERSQKVITLLKMFSKHIVEVRADLVRDRRQD